jgi:hypothetical protein
MAKVADQEQPMYRKTVIDVLPLGLLMALLIFAVSACTGDEQQQGPEARPLPEESQELRPGEYRSEEFKPSLSFKVGESWSNAPPEAFDTLGLVWGETAGLGFVNVQEVYEPTATGTPNVVEAPEDMVGWFRQHPYLQTSKPKPVTVGGDKGIQFDVVVGDLPEDYSSVCGSDCVDLFRSSSGFKLGLGEDTKERDIVLEDVEGETVVIRFGSLAAEFDEFAPEAQKVIDSVEWNAP